MKVYLYGIAGIEDQYRIVRYDKIDGDYEPITIDALKKRARLMKSDYPWIKHVYAIDASPQLAIDYKSTINARRMDVNVDFKCMLEIKGLRIPDHT